MSGAAAAGPAVDVVAHPLLEAAILVCRLPRPLGELPSPAWLIDLLRLDAPVPADLAGLRDDAARAAVRDLLRHGGFKPTGRNKPACEYLAQAAERGELGSINAAVDVCNAVSLHAALPISVVDLDRARSPLRIESAAPGASYVFNRSGQAIDLEGLLCLCDADGPCANAVKDSERTKTSPATTATLSVLWGTRALPGRAARAAGWYAELLRRLGADASCNR
jgi:DNA/RNA-binding domain of Phe-tRNA-synthetase-like protein